MTVPDPAAGDTKRLFLALGLSLVVGVVVAINASRIRMSTMIRD